jgi:hypothetical protein
MKILILGGKFWVEKYLMIIRYLIAYIYVYQIAKLNELFIDGMKNIDLITYFPSI